MSRGFLAVLWEKRQEEIEEAEQQTTSGWEEAVSTIVTINHPGPLWSCPVYGAGAGWQAGRGREEERKRQRKRERGEAEWLQGERGGENGWGSACMSTSAPPVGLGSSAAVLLLVLRVLPDPGS